MKRIKKKFNFSVVNLGCPKNLVEAQHLIWHFLSLSNSKTNPKNIIWQENYEIQYFWNCFDDLVRYVFLNTCGFIDSWRFEAIDMIESLLAKWKKVFVFGCAVSYFDKTSKLQNISDDNNNDNDDKKIKQIDQDDIIKRNNIIKNPNISMISWKDIENITIQDIFEKEKNQTNLKKIKDTSLILDQKYQFEFVDTPRAYTNIDLGREYVKIAEWCNNSCSFCIIPKLRWKQKSLTIDKICEEIKNIINIYKNSFWNLGNKEKQIFEIRIISQDSTRYGIDIYNKPNLIELLQNINNIEENFRFKVFYMYPDILTMWYIKTLSNFEKFVPFFDIPIQHINDDILKSMWRFNSKNHILELFDSVRKNFSNSYIRTNIIIGFPWEDEKIFDELCDFVSDTHIDQISFFEYHDEILAPSYKLPNKIDEKTIRKRFFQIHKIRKENLKKRKKLTKFDFDINVD